MVGIPPNTRTADVDRILAEFYAAHPGAGSICRRCAASGRQRAASTMVSRARVGLYRMVNLCASCDETVAAILDGQRVEFNAPGEGGR